MPITSTCASSRRPIESARSSLQSSKHSCQFQSCAPACLLQTFQEGKNGFRRSHSSSNVFQFQDWRKSCYIMLLHQIAACHASTSSAPVRVQNFYLRAACTFCMAYMAPVIYVCIHTQLHRCANPVGPNCLSTSGTSSRTKISLETRESRHFSCMRDNALSTLGETCHCLPISKTKRALHSMIIGPPTPNKPEAIRIRSQYNLYFEL